MNFYDVSFPCTNIYNTRCFLPFCTTLTSVTGGSLIGTRFFNVLFLVRFWYLFCGVGVVVTFIFCIRWFIFITHFIKPFLPYWWIPTRNLYSLVFWHRNGTMTETRYFPAYLSTRSSRNWKVVRQCWFAYCTLLLCTPKFLKSLSPCTSGQLLYVIRRQQMFTGREFTKSPTSSLLRNMVVPSYPCFSGLVYWSLVLNLFAYFLLLIF